METKNIFGFELQLEKSLRKIRWLIPLITLFTGFLLIVGTAYSMYLFKEHYYWTIVQAAFLTHAFFIVIIHDGAHKSITRTKFDRILMNFGSGLMLLPFYGEYFRKYHLVHHANTNTEVDPLWPKFKKHLFENKRWFYILCEGIPLLFTAYMVFQSNAEKKELKVSKIPNSPKVNMGYLLFSILVSIVVIIYAHPSVLFCLGTLFFLNLISTLRHWCEYLGTDPNNSSNTFWFPLGMGIGNHDTHHHFPQVSWFVLLIGLFARKKTTNPLKTLYSVLFDRSFVHYKNN